MIQRGSELLVNTSSWSQLCVRMSTTPQRAPSFYMQVLRTDLSYVIHKDRKWSVAKPFTKALCPATANAQAVFDWRDDIINKDEKENFLDFHYQAHQPMEGRYKSCDNDHDKPPAARMWGAGSILWHCRLGKSLLPIMSLTESMLAYACITGVCARLGVD